MCLGSGPVVLGFDHSTPLNSRTASLDQSRCPPPRTVRFMSLHPKRSVRLAEETILLRNGLEDPNELFQKLEALRL